VGIHVRQETADERWRPILGVEQILMSVISLFSDPNDTSPANIDAAVRCLLLCSA
jgi:ubiquitin-conjugating enzyme E2 G1